MPELKCFTLSKGNGLDGSNRNSSRSVVHFGSTLDGQTLHACRIIIFQTGIFAETKDAPWISFYSHAWGTMGSVDQQLRSPSVTAKSKYNMVLWWQGRTGGQETAFYKGQESFKWSQERKHRTTENTWPRLCLEPSFLGVFFSWILETSYF